MEGYIRILRSIEEEVWYKKTRILHTFIYILLSMKTEKAIIGDTILEYGDTLISISDMMVSLKTSKKSVENILNEMVKLGIIKIRHEVIFDKRRAISSIINPEKYIEMEVNCE